MDAKYILLLIGYAVYYYIKANGKKKEAVNQNNKRPRPERSSTDRSIEDILREFQQKAEPEPYQESINETDVPKNPEVFVEDKVEKPSITNIESEEEENDDYFDLRQAVINDAILNRPHHF